MIKSLPDTNVVIASKSGNPNSPNKKFFVHWFEGKFELLYSDQNLQDISILRELRSLSEPSDQTEN